MEKKLKVLIADNSNQFATQCQKELETQGYEVSTMENDGARVFDAIAKQKFDVILMDVFMTNEDAVDVLEYYQTHTVEKPIIAVLSTISSEELEKQTMFWSRLFLYKADFACSGCEKNYSLDCMEK